MKEKLRYLVYFGIIISIELFCSFTLNSMGIRKENILMVFIVGVLLIATFTKGYFYGLLASIVSVLCFNFLYIDPNYDFHISDPKGLIYKVQRNKRCFINRSCEETLICLYLQAFSQKGGGKHGTAK